MTVQSGRKMGKALAIPRGGQAMLASVAGAVPRARQRLVLAAKDTQQTRNGATNPPIAAPDPTDSVAGNQNGRATAKQRSLGSRGLESAEKERLLKQRDELARAAAESGAERDRLRIELAEAKREAVLLAAQAAWADEQVISLVASEASLSTELGQKANEAKTLETRIADLETQLRSLEGDRRDREELNAEFRARASRLIGEEFPETVDLLEVIEVIRQRVRKLERELDSEIVERECASARVADFENSVGAKLLRVVRRIRRPGVNLRRVGEAHW
jgi:chromosome segregation ATPase